MELLKRLARRMRRVRLKNVAALAAVAVVLAAIWLMGWDLLDIFDSDWERPTPVETLPAAPFN